MPMPASAAGLPLPAVAPVAAPQMAAPQMAAPQMAAPGRVRERLLYDDGCPLCTFQMSLLTRLDRRGRIEMVPLSGAHAAELVPEATAEQLREAVHVVAADGRVFRGARALRFLGGKLPALWPLAALLWIPGVILVAELAYRLVSRNRHRLGKLFGCGAACRLMPPAERE